MDVIKRDGRKEPFNVEKILNAVRKAYKASELPMSLEVENTLKTLFTVGDTVDIEEIQDRVEEVLMHDNPILAKSFILYRHKHKRNRDWVNEKMAFIQQYKESENTADATIDDNSNVASKNIGILNNEIHKTDNIDINRGMIIRKLKELYPDFDAKSYIRDLEHHIIYKHDESSFAGAIAPYCCSISMYPFLNRGIKDLGGLSASPKNLDSFCGMYINLIFAVASQFAGAVATSEFLVYFDYFARKEWGDSYYLKADVGITNEHCLRYKTIRKQIHQYFQQVIYSINQPAAARGMQAAFVNFSYFDKPFFDGMFGTFYFPDGTQPKWESVKWLQREFMQWFNEERLRTLITFPVESVTLLYKDGKFEDEEMAEFVAEEYARGHSFFTYISDSVDSLSSCCRLKNKIQVHEFNFTNGNMGVETGSKSVISLNLNRIIQDWAKTFKEEDKNTLSNQEKLEEFAKYLKEILERVYKYHHAYNEILWDMYDANLLPVYKAGFISLNKQYLTIGINGLNQAAEFLGIQCTDNEAYKNFCQLVFSTIKEQNTLHNTQKGHKLSFNTECVPAESLAAKNYNWDKEDGYWVPKDTNLYASYIFKPNEELSTLEKIRLHGKEYIGDYLDGGSAAHLNLDHHLDKEQYRKLLHYAAETGCQYFTFNIPNCECDDCGFIAKQAFVNCPRCGSHHVSLWDRIIGYLTKIKNWSEARRIEQQTRVYSNA
jgi:ribonucleoside-triphosphate reductase